MSFISLDFRCLACDHRWWMTVTRSEGSREGALWPCPCCGEEKGERVPSAPHVMNPATASPDGVKRKGWQALKEADRLETEAMYAKPEDKARMQKELAKAKKAIPEGQI